MLTAFHHLGSPDYRGLADWNSEKIAREWILRISGRNRDSMVGPRLRQVFKIRPVPAIGIAILAAIL